MFYGSPKRPPHSGAGLTKPVWRSGVKCATLQRNRATLLPISRQISKNNKRQKQMRMRIRIQIWILIRICAHFIFFLISIFIWVSIYDRTDAYTLWMSHRS